MAAEGDKPFLLCEPVSLARLESVLAIEFDGFVLVFQYGGEACCVLLSDEGGGFFRSSRRGLRFDRKAKLAAMMECHPLLRSSIPGLSGIEHGRINAEQADEGVTRQNIEVNVRQRFKLVFGLR